MEDDVPYASVVFKDGPASHTPNKDEQTIYSEVKKKKPESAATSPSDAAPVVRWCVLPGLVVSLCALLCCTAGLVYLSMATGSQRSEIRRLSSGMSLLREESARLKGQREALQNLTRNLNWTLQVILSFSQFPVSDLCPDKRCRPCMDGWLLFQNSCYLFDESPSPWKTWDQSQAACRDKSFISQLVVVDSPQEQEFIHDHIKGYHDVYHGYWIGLSQQGDDSWVWGDGHQDTLGFWMKKDFGRTGLKALVIPNQTVTESWDPAEAIFLNKFICESKTLIIE